MKPYHPEPILKVYIQVFRPPGHCIDGMGLFYVDFFEKSNFDLKKDAKKNWSEKVQFSQNK